MIKIWQYSALAMQARSIDHAAGASAKADEEEFVKVLESRTKNGDGKLKIVEVTKVEKEIEVKELVSLHKVMEDLKAKYPGLTHNRIPVCNSAAPLESDFDTICNALLGTNVNAPVIVNCQVISSSSSII